MAEVRDGYKITELGEIPLEWDVVQQGDISVFYNGRAYKQTEFKNSGTPIIRIQNLTGIKEPVYSDLILEEQKYANPGDLLYAWSATFGPYIWNGPRSIFHYHIWRIEINEKILDKLFYYYRLDFVSRELQGKKNGFSFVHITKSLMESHKIALPPLKEQQKIAEILSSVDTQIEQTEQLIEKTKELKKGLMQQLLTKGIGHTEFKQSELGEIPVTWGVASFEELGVFFKGKGIAKKDLSELGEPCILYGQLYTTYKEVIKEIVYRTDIKVKNPVIGYANDLLIPSSGETAIDIATSAALMVDCVLIGGDINLFRPNQSIDSRFVSFQLNSTRKEDLAKLAQGSSVYHLYAPSLSGFKILIAPLEEQQKIASILSTVDAEIASYEQEKAKYEELKKGLMQQLLTGKIRVKVDA
ncbi:type I restriction enzyme S subunit [Ureibacillus xyleni]|uniref:Type I restriction enzyme S subunit n=1 Tax=Ureibacillus xyleni TaxID=614648 RepID=A0A285THN0_9BACL|nr:restriction endonuclease subunit S [Ureibacillus xyleni]SOC21710.1 type I restriction enzyme S subunit [Ureibacillus xyleni]